MLFRYIKVAKNILYLLIEGSGGSAGNKNKLFFLLSSSGY